MLLVPLSELIEPEGCPEWGYDLFQVTDDYDGQLLQVSARFALLVNERFESDDPGYHGLCLPTLVREFTRLVDELAPPNTTHEFAYVNYLMGRAIHHTMTLITGIGKLTDAQPIAPANRPGFNNRNNQATA